MKLNSFTVSLLVLLLAFLISFTFYWKRTTEIEAKKLYVQAVDECQKTAKMNWTDQNNGSQVTEPYKPAYEKCLKDKGY